MAARRKTYVAHRGPTPTEAHTFAEFMADLLDGTINAEKLIEVRDGQGRLVLLQYDDPNG